MSYSAFVICDCYQKGKTIEPPHKEYVKFDKEGLYIDIPDDLWKKEKKKVFQMDNDFESWKNNACEHEEMELCHEHLSNNLGMEEFRENVKNLGGKVKYPVLTKYLPKVNGGILPAKYALDALKELIELKKEKHTEERVNLVEKQTNELIATVNAETHLFFVFTKYKNNTYYYGIDNQGFFILRNIKENEEEKLYVVFRSNSFRQKEISENETLFIDNKTNDVFCCSVNLSMNQNKTDDFIEFIIKKEKVQSLSRYKFMIESLMNLTRASLKTGNPIHWT